jgi:hypothetical protein
MVSPRSNLRDLIRFNQSFCNSGVDSLAMIRVTTTITLDYIQDSPKALDLHKPEARARNTLKSQVTLRPMVSRPESLCQATSGPKPRFLLLAELLYDWRFTVHQFVLPPSLLRHMARDFFNLILPPQSLYNILPDEWLGLCLKNRLRHCQLYVSQI